MKMKSKLEIEAVVEVGVQPLFQVGGGWMSNEWSDKTKLIPKSTQFKLKLELSSSTNQWVLTPIKLILFRGGVIIKKQENLGQCPK